MARLGIPRAGFCLAGTAADHLVILNEICRCFSDFGLAIIGIFFLFLYKVSKSEQHIGKNLCRIAKNTENGNVFCQNT